ncbi:LuxR C-terminal-related transcriptional regulator [Bacillus rubiinfantis]|uniref:LuxR C-terminal-related transcriptional regulator n=1 Tax=Bacillus rubiinfantis TaxID=1499680 RepID=UPI0006946766|nr:LuxR C-terminal-related transcriptional regulator [Bacillus rubiinfantis]
MLNELLNTYSCLLHVPIILYSLSGKVEDSTDTTGLSFISESDFKEFIQTAKYIHSSTIVTKFDERLQLNLQYILSPIISFPSSQLLMVAGPFHESRSNDSVELQISTLNREKKEFAVTKITALATILAKVAAQEEKAHFRQELENSLEIIDESNPENYDEAIAVIMDRVLSFGKVDFLGVARIQEHPLVKIDIIRGEKAKVLQGKKFYIGEGILGKAIVTGKEIYWHDNGDNYQVEYFNRYNVKPLNLFCLPLTVDGQVEGLFFGGSTVEKNFCHSFLSVVSSFVYYINQKNIRNIKMHRMKNNLAIYEAWMDVIDVSLQNTDTKAFIYKLLDFCQTYNGGRFSCFTSSRGEFSSRGKPAKDMISRHQELAQEFFSRPAAEQQVVERKVDNCCIHQPLAIDENIHGILSIEIANQLSVERFLPMLEILKNAIIKIRQHPLTAPARGQSKVLTVSDNKGKELAINHDKREIINMSEIGDVLNLASAIVKLPLTAREKEILHLILEGLNNQEVADYLSISFHTVKNHVTNIFKKLNVTDRIQAMTKIYRIKFGEEQVCNL